jgi:hypothetical protein
MKALIIVGILIWQTSVFAQGTFVYRTGGDVTFGIDIDLDLDGTTDFQLTHPVNGIGDIGISSRRLAPSTYPFSPSQYVSELMADPNVAGGIDWMAGAPILPDPSPSGEWTTTAINMRHMLMAVRLQNGDDWNYGWMRFEKIGEDQFGERWGLRDAAYNSIPNAPINMLQVPELSTFVLMLSGAAVVLFSLHRKRRTGRRCVNFL